MTSRGGRSRKRSHASSSSSTPSSTPESSFPDDRQKDSTNPSHAFTQKRNREPYTFLMPKRLSLSSSTLRAIGVLCFAIMSGVAWNAWDGTPTWPSASNYDDRKIRSFLARVCKSDDVFCNPSLVHRRRTQMVLRKISGGEQVLEIPRAMTLWDLDALRHDWIRQHFLGAKHKETGNRVDSAAYLAVYLALLSKQFLSLPAGSQPKSNDANNMNDNKKEEDEEALRNEQNRPRLLQYLQDCLPTAEELQKFHPIFWNETELMELLPPHLATFGVVKAYRDMVKSEYQTFVNTAKQRKDVNLRDMLSETEYQTFRVLVLSRSFGTGPLPVQATSSSSDSSLSNDEIEYCLNEFGIDLSRGSYAMVPILDFYDHHARPNVEYAYNNDRGVFAIRATGQGIAAGHEVVDSYGKYTDSHLFAKFGFVNGDGSGYSQANLATNHRVLDMDLKQQFSNLPFRKSQQLSESIKKALEKQKQGVLQYLRFDDGYQECVSLENGNPDRHPKEAYELKRLKSQHLAKIANHAKRWHLVLLPNDPESLPARASNIPITYNPPKVTKQNANFFHRKEYQLIAATCRLISLTHEDYDGKAVELLKKNLNNNGFLLEPQLKEDSSRGSMAAALEFRTHFCLARLASEALQRFVTALPDLEDKVARLNRQSYQSKEWAAAHIQLSEMQALEVLRGASVSAARQYEDLRNQSPAFSTRNGPCFDSGAQ